MKYKMSLLVLLLAAAMLCCAAAEEQDGPISAGLEESGQVELIQCGSLSGPITLPGAPDLLDAEDDAIYQTIYEGLLDQAESITLTRGISCTSETLNAEMTAFQNKVVEKYALVANDHPRLFYVTEGYSSECKAEGPSYSDLLLTVTLCPTYRDTVTQAEIRAFNDRVDELVDLARGYGTPLEQALFLHDYLMDHVTYNWGIATAGDSEEEQAAAQAAADPMVFSAYGALVDGDAVCEGYALAYRLLLGELGIPCITVASDQMNHMWNLVELDDRWYHVDVTHDDPTPNVAGGGRHANFLRSDTGIAETGHHDWEGTGIVCTADYEENWWLNEVQFPLYFWENNYYYVKLGTEPFEYRVYRTTSLDDPGTAVSQTQLGNSYSTLNGVLWLDGQLYYTNANGADGRVLTRCRLSDGATAPVGAIPFTPAKSGDGHYSAEMDGVGLSYDGEAGVIRPSSNTRPALELPAFAPRTYPVEWDRLSTDENALAGGIWTTDTTLQLGVISAQPEESAPAGYLLAAFYRDGRMISLHLEEILKLSPGLNLVDLGMEPDSQSDQLIVFWVTRDGLMPLAEPSSLNTFFYE